MYKIPIKNTFSVVCSVNIQTNFSQGGYAAFLRLDSFINPVIILLLL